MIKIARMCRGRGVVAALLVAIGCGGSPFEQGSTAASELAGAAGDAGAVSIGSGGSSMLSGAAGEREPGDGGAGRGEVEPGVGGSSSSGAGGLSSGGLNGTGGVATKPVACDVSSWEPSAFASLPNGAPAAAVDGSELTHWSSGESQATGQWFALAFPPVVLEQLELRSLDQPNDVPQTVALELDGKPVAATASSPELGVLRLAFVAKRASSVRLVLTNSGPLWWSIAELTGTCRR